MKTQLTMTESIELMKEYKGYEIYNANTHYTIKKVGELDFHQVHFDDVIDAEYHIDRLVERDSGVRDHLLTESEMKEKTIAFLKGMGFGKYRAEGLTNEIIQAAYEEDNLKWEEQELCSTCGSELGQVDPFCNECRQKLIKF